MEAIYFLKYIRDKCNVGEATDICTNRNSKRKIRI